MSVNCRNSYSWPLSRDTRKSYVIDNTGNRKSAKVASAMDHQHRGAGQRHAPVCDRLLQRPRVIRCRSDFRIFFLVLILYAVAVVGYRWSKSGKLPPLMSQTSLMPRGFAGSFSTRMTTTKCCSAALCAATPALREYQAATLVLAGR